jgi:hypothetical protein
MIRNDPHRLKEEIHVNDKGEITVVNHFSGNQLLLDAKHARETSPNAVGSDWKHVGQVHPGLVHIWLKEAGVSWSDPTAVAEVIKRKLMDGEYSQLRGWEGKW